MKSLEETFKENQQHVREQLQYEIKMNKKRQKQEKIIVAVCGVLIGIALITLFGFICRNDSKYLQQCLEKGHSTNYCYKNL